MGGVTEYTYDGLGNVTRTLLYANAVPASGTYDTFVQISNALGAAGNSAGAVRASYDRVRWTAYDTAGRKVYDVDAQGGVTRTSYDANSLVVETREFAQLNAGTSSFLDKATLDAWVNSGTVNSDSANRTTRFWYDGAGRARFMLNAAGYLTETRYDDAASTTREVAYLAAPAGAITAGSTTANVASVATGLANSATDRSTVTTYDKLGRTLRVADAYGFFEEFTYDALGNKRAYRNQKSAVWDYDYDAMGRVTYEYTPAVDSYSVTGSPTSLTLSGVTNARITTKIEYDAFGNVWKRTEAFGTGSARTTEYIYDALGRQDAHQLPGRGVLQPGHGQHRA